ncbi:MAG: membrane protein insertion efficiency factor YidD [Acidobacteriia bacterium]|nr:membrane protein insertion efficiency factor YidD [Terriglobia bacterium]
MKFLALGLLRIYKRWISPVFPPSCRYVPTCSEYAMEAVERFGTVRGGMMAVWRLLRCHPFAKGGLDPVVGPTLPQSTRKDGAPAVGNAAELRSAGQPRAAVPTWNS